MFNVHTVNKHASKSMFANYPFQLNIGFWFILFWWFGGTKRKIDKLTMCQKQDIQGINRNSTERHSSIVPYRLYKQENHIKHVLRCLFFIRYLSNQHKNTFLPAKKNRIKFTLEFQRNTFLHVESCTSFRKDLKKTTLICTWI